MTTVGESDRFDPVEQDAFDAAAAVFAVAAAEARGEAATAYLELTEHGIAQAFADRYSGRFLYDCSRGRWYVWDGSRWAEERHRAALRAPAPTRAGGVRSGPGWAASNGAEGCDRRRRGAVRAHRSRILPVRGRVGTRTRFSPSPRCSWRDGRSSGRAGHGAGPLRHEDHKARRRGAARGRLARRWQQIPTGMVTGRRRGARALPSGLGWATS